MGAGGQGSVEPAAPGLSLEQLLALIDKTAFAKKVGVDVIKFAEGEVEISVPITKSLTQHHGFVHGVVVGFVADSACAWAAASVAGDVVTAEYKINLIAPAVGERLIGRGSVIKSISRQVICRADVFVEQAGRERLVATALATIAKVAFSASSP
jgi:uncharacterized protein (TIGR00369 family)